MIEVIELTQEEAAQLEERIKNRQLNESDYDLLEGLLNTYFHLNHLLEGKKLSIKRLLRLFWNKSEKSGKIFKKDQATGTGTGAEESKEVEDTCDTCDTCDTSDTCVGNVGGESGGQEREKESGKDKKPGHGRNGADQYPGADQIEVAIDGLKAGDICPACEKGKLYNWKPGKVLRLTGGTPVKCRLYKMTKLRCSLCQEIFSSQLPKEAGEKKYDQEAGSIVALLKYGFGMPFNRLSVLQQNLGVPLAPSTQWEIVKLVSQDVSPVYDELLWQGAQGEVIHNDDTEMEILELLKENQRGENPDKRKGRFTTGIVCESDKHKIALFFSGRNHAGENLTRLLEQRNSWLPPPIQMCDALSRNLSSKFKTTLSYCLLHGRRNFIDIAETFPGECKHVIDTLATIYKHERIANELKMIPGERLKFHQQESGPVMNKLKTWFEGKLEEKKVEPNSSIGKAIEYMIKHWQQLTLFLRKEGAPLDNNLVERSLKMAILNRKNAYFYKTQNGADVGDIFMSIIQTCKFTNVNAFEYLTRLQKHSARVKEKPHQWLPWNYKESAAEITREMK
jgi:hypothetical protein